ncbi:MAG: reverse transcriptase domain-containing protein [Candidatus Paceibacterota bacterium]
MNFCDVISIDNLFLAWKNFSLGKKSKPEVAHFELELEENLFDLHQELLSEAWKPRPYVKFSVCDPKLREIHKADIRDMILYQAVYQSLYQIFDPIFIFDSYSSRKTKGTHAGIERFVEFSRKVSSNYRAGGYALKCDIRKFFDSIDHKILLGLMRKRISDKKLMTIIEKIIFSFEKSSGKGLPLGNVTSQLFSNIYLNELDQFIKHELKARYYIRYCDDFVILSDSLEFLGLCLERIRHFCQKELLLELHPDKVHTRKLNSGVDFLGYICLPHRKVLRTKTKNRILNKIKELKESFDKRETSQEKLGEVISSYSGMLGHCRGEKTKEQIERIFWD